MKVFAIAALVTFFIVKAVAYSVSLMSKRGYVTDYSRVLSIVMPIMSVMTYVGCFYMIGDVPIGFVITIVLAWVGMLITLAVVHALPYAACYITSNDNYECYRIASGVVKYIKKKDREILVDDNIGIGNTIKITFDRRRFTRDEMNFLVREQYTKQGAVVKRKKVSLLALMIHIGELLFDISFLANICML